MTKEGSERRWELRLRYGGITDDEAEELWRLERELNSQFDADFIRDQAAAAQPLETALYFAERGDLLAERGDLEPLRKMYPMLARFIKRPKRRMGPPKKPAVYSDYSFRARGAYKDAQRIRALWKERAGRTVHRVCGHLASWYAARLWYLEDEDDVEVGRRSGGPAPRWRGFLQGRSRQEGRFKAAVVASAKEVGISERTVERDG